MVRLKGHLICLTEDEAATVRHLRPDHLAATRAEPGCLSFDILDTDDPLIFEVVEAFRDRPGFDAHQSRTRDSAWFAATRTILRNFRIEELGD